MQRAFTLPIRIAYARGIAAAAFCAALVFFQYSSHAAPDTSTPKKAGIVFAKAMQTGDMEMLHQVVIGPEESLAVFKLLSGQFVAMKRFEDAAVKKFGNEGKLGEELLSDMVAQFEAAEEIIDGDNATLNTSFMPNLPMKKTSSGWKLSFPTEKNPKVDTTYMDMSRRTIPACIAGADAATRDLEAGKFKTAGEAKKNLTDRMTAAMMAAMYPPATQPATRPAGDKRTHR